MKEFTSEEIQAKFDSLPQELKEAISAPDIFEKIQDIGKRHNLLIDKVGDLVDQVGLVMLGLTKGSNFVNDISERLSIDHARAQLIATDINSEVLSSIKTHMRQASEPDQPVIKNTDPAFSSLERAGGFSIEREAPKSNQSIPVDATTSTNDRRKFLSDLENPPRQAQTFSEPLVDHLLQNTSAQPEERTMVESPSQPIKPTPVATPAPVTPAKPIPPKLPVQPKPSGPDMYREPV